MNKIICGDSITELKSLESNSVDLLCTDPPYGYSFMGKQWDKTLPDIGIFKECHRVLKSGAFAFVMSAPRSDVCARMMLMLEDAGFNIGFTPIYWTYASGFPKAMNIGKSEETKQRIAAALKGKRKSEEHRRALSKARLEKYDRIGRKQPRAWNRNGRYRIWMLAVRERDGNKCVWCGAIKNLQVDHIKPYSRYPELVYEISNGRVLCAPCHRKTPTYGVKSAVFKVL